MVVRSFFPIQAMILIWGSLLWGSWFSLVLVLVMFHLVTWLERWLGEIHLPGPEDISPPRRTWLLAHPEDIHCLVYTLIFFAGVGSAFWLYLHPDRTGFHGFPSRLGFMLGAGSALGWAAGVNLGVNYHNHLHCGIFKSRAVNQWYGRLWTIPCGWPAYFWKHKHLAVHHRHVHEAADWVQPRTRPDGRYESLPRYIFLHWPWRYARHFWIDFRSGSAARRRRAIREFSFFFVLWSIPFFIDPIMGLGLWLYPQWVGSAFVLGCGMYTQHVGGSRMQRFSHSTTFLSRFFNWTMFNVGFHTEHHEFPQVHWSQLPALHRRLKLELIEGGAHVVSYGSYRASGLLSSLSGSGLAEFSKQHPGYQQCAQGPDHG